MDDAQHKLYADEHERLSSIIADKQEHYLAYRTAVRDRQLLLESVSAYGAQKEEPTGQEADQVKETR